MIGQNPMGVGGLGYGQTWQNMTTSRTLGVTYTNATGKPIALMQYANNTSMNILYINGVETIIAISTSSQFVPISSVIPIGATYSISGTYNPAWWELR